MNVIGDGLSKKRNRLPTRRAFCIFVFLIAIYLETDYLESEAKGIQIIKIKQKING